MFDSSIDLAMGAVATSVGWISGMLLGHRLRRSRVAPPPQDSRLCGCGHHYALHSVEDAECFQEVRREHYYDNGARNGWEYVQCECRRYTGEVPLDLSTLDLPGMPRRDHRNAEESS